MAPRSALLALLLLVPAAPVQAQSGLEAMFTDIFTELLDRRLVRVVTNPQFPPHGDHYLPAAEIAKAVLVPALSGFVAANVTGFPSSSSQLGVTLDFSSGQPVTRIDRLGPIFAETAGTIGARRLSLGANATYLSLDRIRGGALDEMTFRFLHQDVDENGTGNIPFERDVLVIEPNLDLNATLVGLYGTYGLTDQLDVGLAIPIFALSASGEAVATVDISGWGGAILHHYGTAEDPQLSTTYAYEASEVTVPNVAVRAKYRLPTRGVALAVLGEVQIPTAGESSLLGSQRLVGRARLIGSRAFGTMNTQLNLGYDLRGADADPDLLAMTLGFDTNVAPDVSVSGGLIGRLPVTAGERARFYDTGATSGEPGAYTQVYLDGEGNAVEVPFSNISNRNDGSLVATLGARLALTQRVLGMVNVLVPVVQGGLQSTIAPTVGLSVYL